LKWINSKYPRNRIEIRRIQGIIRKMIRGKRDKFGKGHILEYKAIWDVNEVQKHGEY
jgi:hypothetical protein